MKRTALVALALILLSTSAAAQKKASKEVLNYKGKAAKLFVRNLNGPLEVVGVAAGAQLEIVATATGSGDLAQVKVETHAGKDSLTVCAMFPGYKSSCGPDGHHDSSGNRNGHDDLDVKIVVKLPRGQALDVELVNGAVIARGLAADTEIETVNGRVEIVQENGKVEIESVNGSVSVTTGASGNLDVETVNGSVDVKLAGGGDVRAETVNGRVDIGGEKFEREARKTLGKGGRRVVVETVNGSISVQ
jgi:hypothetical protein